MRKFLIATLVAVGSLAAIIPAAHAQRGGYTTMWHSISMNRDGDGWGYAWGYYYEEDARTEALYQCNIRNAYNCANGVSVERDWWLAGLYCNDGYAIRTFTAGSQWSQRQANENAFQKAYESGYRNPYGACRVVIERSPF